jgi:hypothetical protein
VRAAVVLGILELSGFTPITLILVALLCIGGVGTYAVQLAHCVACSSREAEPGSAD